ncbi:aldehyde dehydrogenase [Acetivibrio straminisolvens JCM 21531]|uniref:Aldehyde dehydrogenase n=1 Tax=Acetivibrio straminisolvens JCM 21531 TaxID=1294263 RepID=W4VCB9_9FIRM|nr:aldehyde dehydrogenase [Acetivibrio straminisolvens JCM 21531]
MFYWKYLFNKNVRNTIQEVKVEFQSLFYWKYLFNSPQGDIP